MTYNVRQMKLNVSKNPNEEVLAIYDSENKSVEKGTVLAIIINNKSERYLKFRDRDEKFESDRELEVEGMEYIKLIGRLNASRSKLEKIANSEVKVVESTYDREDSERKVDEGFLSKVKKLTNKVADIFLGEEYDDDEEYDDEEYDDEGGYEKKYKNGPKDEKGKIVSIEDYKRKSQNRFDGR